MICKKCGKENAADAVFCEQCGEKLDISEALTETVTEAAETVEAVAETAETKAEAAVETAEAEVKAATETAETEVKAVAEEVTAVAAPENKEVAVSEGASALDAIKNIFKNPKTKMIALIACAAVALIVVFLIVFGIVSSATNSYKTPIKKAAQAINDEAQGKMDNPADYLSFCSKEIKEFYDILNKSEDDEDEDDEKDIKLKITFKNKEKLDKDDIEDFNDSLDLLADKYEKLVDELDELDSDEIADYAEDLEISKSKAKKLINIIESIYKKLKKAKATNGYEVKVKYKYSGDDAGDFDSETSKVNTYKVNGKWISDADIAAVSEIESTVELYLSFSSLF